MTLNELGQEILTINRANGFGEMTPADWDTNVRMVPTVLCLIHSEVSEALEEFRKQHRKDQFAEELADVLIRTLDCAAALGLDMDVAVIAKLEKNRQRAYKHGGRLI
jgi:NTP pyrophosphatase (non-canonical NTP hydrolase)